MASVKKCLKCGKRPRRNTHFNTKWCNPCRKALLANPKGTLSPEQRRFAARHSGDMTVAEIAKRLGVSRSNVIRSCHGIRFHSLKKYKANPALVKEVLEYYFEHGKSATVEAFPNVNVKCLVDRPEYYGIRRRYRQVRWTREQHIEAIKMAGLVPMAAQARFFNRPGAHLGSIYSFWMKRMKMSGGQLHGMSEWNAHWIVTDKCPRIETGYWSRRNFNKKTRTRRVLVLWIDAEKHLKPDVPEFLHVGISAMADFTRWVFESNNPKRKIMRMIRERSGDPDVHPHA